MAVFLIFEKLFLKIECLGHTLSGPIKLSTIARQYITNPTLELYKKVILSILVNHLSPSILFFPFWVNRDIEIPIPLIVV